MDITEGASDNELILAACHNDQEDLLEDILQTNDYDINFRDGRGETALHYAAKSGSLACLEMLVKVPGIQLNIQDSIEKETPLFKAIKYSEDTSVALAMVDVLLEAGADPRIKNGEGMTPMMVVSEKDEDMYELLNSAIAGYEVDDSDVAIEEDADIGDAVPTE